MSVNWHLVFCPFFAAVWCARRWFSSQYRVLARQSHGDDDQSAATLLTLFVTFNLFWDGQELPGGRTRDNLWRTMKSTMRMAVALEWLYYLCILMHVPGQWSEEAQQCFYQLIALCVWVKVSWFLAASATNDFDVKCIVLAVFAAVFYVTTEFARYRIAWFCTLSDWWWYLIGKHERYGKDGLLLFSLLYAYMVFLLIFTK
jgi:hypothetical protein